MIIKIPQNDKKFKQTNLSDILGNIWSSFNLDLTRNIGRIRVSPRGMITATSATLTNMGIPVSFNFFSTGGSDNKIWAIAGTKMFYNTSDTNSSWTEDATAGTITVGYGSDMEVFRDALYVVGTSEIRKYDGSAWTEIGTNIGTSSTSCCVYAGRFYWKNNTSKISSLDLNDTVSNASTPNTVNYTLQLANFDFGGSSGNQIVSIRASSNRIWIATKCGISQNHQVGKKGKIFEWDGVSPLPNKVYYLDSLGAGALIIKDDIPYVMDLDGRLLKFNGTGFKEVARLPIPPIEYLHNPNGSVGQTFIHPRGIIEQNGRILMLINNFVDISTNTILENLPAGVWEYDEEIGLYHKQSISEWVSGSTTTRTDFAQNRIEESGALFNAKNTSDSANLDGTLLMGASYYTDNSTNKYGIFINNTLDTKSKVGYFVTPKIDSQNAQDNWQKVYATHKLLLDSTDRICIKYRTTEIPPVEGAITWTSTTTFTSTLGLSAFAIGDEVEITQGTGGGQIEHITSIVNNAGTYTVTLANAVTGASGTAKARFQKWISLGEQTSQAIDFKEFPIAQNSSWIQFKIVMYFTGEDEFNYLQLVSQPHLLTA